MARKLKLEGALGHGLADKRLDILRRVGEGGSISQAAREAGVSYKAAWQALDTLSNLAGAVLVERVVGGAGGGGARLSAAGRELLAAAAAMDQARAEVLARLSTRTARGFGLQTSMRNQWPARVESVKPSQGAMRIVLALATTGRVVSRITRESAQLLSLAPGVPVLALCKATAVRVRASRPEDSGTNLLEGHVMRGTRAAEGGEVALELAEGLRLVGFSAGPMAAGREAVAVIDESAVAIALAS